MTATRRSGFTVVELLITLATALVLMAAFQGLLLHQMRFSTWETDLTDVHDANRILWTLLSRDVSDAVPATGDLRLPAPDSLVLRAFSGLGFACAVSTNPGVLSVAWSDGVGWTPDDSLMVHTAGGWRSMKPLSEIEPLLPLGCGTFSVRPDHTYALLELVGDAIPVGAPVRVFRWRAYHMTTAASGRWLARSEGGYTERLIGPLAVDGLRFDFVNAAGATTSETAGATSLRVVAALERSPGPYVWSGGGDTVRVSIPLRNR